MAEAAVLEQVAREVYNGCLCGALAGVTRVLVTNQLQFVSGADRVLFMADGRVAEAGSYAELIQAGGGFAQLMRQAEVRRHLRAAQDELKAGMRGGSLMTHALSIQWLLRGGN